MIRDGVFFRALFLFRSGGVLGSYLFNASGERLVPIHAMPN
jgi:hypothetical protein